MNDALTTPRRELCAAPRRLAIPAEPSSPPVAQDAPEAVSEEAGGAAAVAAPRPDVAANPTAAATLRRWRDELLDLSRRNPLISLGDHGIPLLLDADLLADLEDTVADGPRIELRGLADLTDLDVPAGARSAEDLDAAVRSTLLTRDLVVFSRREDAELRGAVTALRRRAKDISGESGATPLYLTIGGVVVPGRAATDVAPLFLLPVTLEARPGQRASLQLETAGRVQINECLIEWLRRDFGLELDCLTSPPERDNGLDVAGILYALTQAFAEEGRPLTIVPDCRLALIELSRLSMWRDLRDHAGVFLANPLIAHLASPGGLFEDPAPEPALDEMDEALLITPLPADGAQTAAVRWARAGRTFVLEGPPGTGKSQTIANVIADALADDRRVLFVAEKGSAVLAVQHRLRRLGLAAWCLDLHDRDVTDRSVRGALAVATKSALRAHETTQPISEDLAARHSDLLRRLARLPATIRAAAAVAPVDPDATAEVDTDARRADVREFVQVRASVLAHRPEEIAHRTALRLAAGLRDGAHGLGAFDAERRHRDIVGVAALLAEHTEAVLATTPCVIASPSSVATLLPARLGLFDLVVFDEASQLRVADAIGAAGRGRAVVIAGDSRQMPPSDLFANGRGDDAVDEGESILVEAVRRGVPTISLTWHYRSRIEGLVAFSNERYYDGRLASFPSPPGAHLDGGVEFRRAGGQYEGGGRQGKRVNRIEAAAVVAELERLLTADPEASVGVVTFNADQRDLILDLLEAFEPNTPVRAALRRLDAPLIVKALEHIQGEERDHILFSLTYSAGGDGRLPANFGRLSSAGGERRLNVAITRARLRNVLFCSFEPEDIDRSAAVGVGPAHLRDYLKAARAHGVGGRPAPAGPAHDDEGCGAQIARALRARGVEVREHVGRSTFRVDLAVRRPDGEWVAVQLDTLDWARRGTVSDRDVLPEAVLVGSMGWGGCHQFYRQEWTRDPAETLVQILDLAGYGASGDVADIADIADIADLPIVSSGAVAQPSPEAHLAGPSAQRRAEPAWIEDDDADERIRYGAGPGEYVVAKRFIAADDTAAYPHHYLADMHTARRRALVSAQWRGVVTAEGPILRERAAVVVAHRFDTSPPRRGRKQRDFAACLPENLPASQTHEGFFLWPQGAVPEHFRVVRTSPRPERTIAEIAPEERRNAVLFALAHRGGHATLATLLADAAQLFGFQPRARGVEASLRRAVEELAAAEAIEQTGSDARLPRFDADGSGLRRDPRPAGADEAVSRRRRISGPAGAPAGAGAGAARPTPAPPGEALAAARRRGIGDAVVRSPAYMRRAGAVGSTLSDPQVAALLTELAEAQGNALDPAQILGILGRRFRNVDGAVAALATQVNLDGLGIITRRGRTTHLDLAALKEAFEV